MAAASRTQSSNSGDGVHHPAVAPRDLEPHGAERRLDAHDFALQTLAVDVGMPQADGRRLPKDDVRNLREPIRARAITVSSVPGRFFFI